MSYASEKLIEAERAAEIARQYTFPVLGFLSEISCSEDAPKRERLLAARILAERTIRCRKCKDPLLFCGQPIPGGKQRYRKRLLCTQCALNEAREGQRARSLTSYGRAQKLCHGAMKRAEELGLDFDLDACWVQARIECGCEVTSLPFQLAARDHGRQHPFAPSLDRKDPSRGYTKDNVRVVVWIHNLAKSDWDDECVISYAQALLLSRSTKH